jgi:glycosyltransferase involved in cell wall biosynthesis
MNILLASHGFPPTHSAGAERRAERMAKWLNSQGHRVVVFTVERVNDPHEHMETTEQDGFIVHRLYFDLSTVGSGEPFHNFYDNPFVRERLEFVLDSEQFDLVHIVCGYLLGVPAIEVSKQFGLPLAITLTEFWFMCTRLNLIQMTGALCSGPESVNKCTRCLLEDKRRYRLPAQNIPALMDMFWPVSHQIGLTADMQRMVIDRQTRLKHALEMVDLVICPSQFLIDKFKEFGFNTERFIHIRQGLVAPVSQDENHRQWQMQDTPLQFTYVGQIKYHKGVDILIEAFIDLLKINPNIRLELWGNETESPDYVNRLKQRSKQYPAIHWNGPFIGNKIWDILRQTDALVVPSRWYENSPNAILEAFSMGVPVITTNLGGMAELVKHEQNGLLFELDRPDDLRTQLSRLVQDQTLLPRLREGIPKIKTLNQEMTDMLEEYHQLIANGV